MFIQMKDGQSFVDKYQEKKSAHVFLKARGKIKVKDVRAISVERKSGQYQDER